MPEKEPRVDEQPDADEESTRELAEAKEQLEKAEEEVKSKLAEVQKLKDQLSETTRTLGLSKVDCRVLTRELKDKTEKCDKLIEENQTLKKKHDEHASQILVLQEKLDEVTLERDSALTRIEENLNEIKNLEISLAGVEDDVRAKAEQLELIRKGKFKLYLSYSLETTRVKKYYCRY